MRWSELQQDAYWAQKYIRQAEEAKAIRTPITEDEKTLALDRLAKVLEQLHVKAALQAIQEDVWQEGEIREIKGGVDGRRARAGIELVSAPYPALRLGGQGKELTAEIVQANAVLGVYAFSSLSLQETASLGVGDSSIFGIDRSSDLQEMVLKNGLQDGLRRVAAGNYNNGVGLDRQLSGGINIADTDAQGKLFLHLVDHVNYRTRKGLLPGELREWSNNLLQQLPESLLEQGRANTSILREWGHDVRGSSRLVRALDRILPIPVGI